MIVTVEVLWPMNMNMLIRYCHEVIFLAGCSIDDHERGTVVTNEYEIVDHLLSRYDSFGRLFD